MIVISKMDDANQTKIDSWFKLQESLGKRQYEVYAKLKEHPLSNRELSKELGLPINSITPRVKELREGGLVFQHSVKFDSLTNRNVAVWSVLR